jgi:type III secretion protein O
VNKYPLARMLTVRELREEQASSALRKCLADLAAATEELEARKREVAEALESLRRTDRACAAATVGVAMDSVTTHAWQRELNAWRFRVDEAETAQAAAAAHVLTMRIACDKARTVYQAKMKDKHKIESHREIWTAEAAKEAEAAEEKELEESARGKSARS